MASASPSLVLYAGGAATYVCESGDVQPTFPHLPAITEDLLRLLQSSSLSSSPSAAAAVMDRHPSHQQSRSAAKIREHLFPMLRQCTLFLVLPLACAASYQEAWVRLCFHADVAVHRLLVLSDTVADSFACGQGSCLALHASLHTISVSRVEAGCSTRYINSRVGSVQAICGEAATTTLANELPRTAAAISAAAPPHSSSESDEEEEEDVAAEVCARGGAEVGIDLGAAAYRDSLVHAFGYHAYRAVVVVPQHKHLDRETRGTGKGRGKGKGKGRAASSSTSPSLLDALKHAYPREVREAPGQVERLVARVVQGETVTCSESGKPCILAGEALAVPLLAQLFAHVIRRCGSKTWSAVEEERKAKQRQKHATSADAGAGQEQGEDPAQKRHKAEASRSSSSESGSDSTSSDGEDIEEDDAWLTLQPTPLPRAPWWLPLLGGSIVSRLGDRDLLRHFITEEEARESNGTVVHWKTLQ